jgi:glutathione synthase/RimK-type ligase-like ATP-grasp enzyme
MDVVVDVGARPSGKAILTSRDLSTPGWRYDPLRPEDASLVVGGRLLTASAIASVKVVDAAVRSSMISWIDPGDRAYAAAEMTAALTTWLGLFPGPVERRPQAPSPLGPCDEPNGGRPLLVGSSVDTPTLQIRSCLYNLGCSPLIIDERTCLDRDIPAMLRTGIIGTVPLTEIGAVFLRPDGSLGASQYALLSWAQCMRGIVVNRPTAMALNAAKPLQLAMISRHGFDVPETLVTTSAEAAGRFAAKHERVVFKSVSGVRSIVTELTDDAAERLRDVEVCPTMFQEFVPGVDVRVHVVGSELFACEIVADRIDYRYSRQMSMHPVTLPQQLCERLVAMVRTMGLHVAGIDLRRRPDGGWTCLEVNPSPAFTWFTELTGQPVAEVIASLLLGERRERSPSA